MLQQQVSDLHRKLGPHYFSGSIPQLSSSSLFASIMSLLVLAGDASDAHSHTSESFKNRRSKDNSSGDEAPAVPNSHTVLTHHWPLRVFVCSAVPSDPLPAMSMREKAIKWSVDEVCSFFRSQGMDRVASLFHACHIDGRQISQCTFQLQGIPSVSHNVQTCESLFAPFTHLTERGSQLACLAHI